MRSIFNSLEEGVFVVSPDRKLANVNAAAERMFGYSKGELANRSTEILHIDHEQYVEFGKLINELQNALAQVKNLRGLLPICSHCKNIRDDKGYWNKIENYIHQHSDAEFSHGICPECAKKYYPNLEIYED